jgi:HK97 family phage portal protein
MQLIDSIKSFLGIEKVKALQSYSSITMHNQIFPTWQSWREIQAFQTVEDIYTVVNRLAKECANIPIYGYDMKGNDLADSDKFAQFLRTQTRAKKYEMFLWYWLRGESFIYKDRFIGADARVEKLYFLNPNFVTLIINDVFPFNVVRYRYTNTNAGIDIFIDLEDMIFIKDFNPTDDFQLSFRGLSKVQVLAKRLTKLSANINNSVAQMQNGGVPGIVYQKDLNPTPDSAKVVGSRRDNFSRFLQNSDNKGAPFFAAGEMGYLKLGLSTVELDAIKAELSDFKKVCNAFSLSDRLFNNDATGSEISDDNARKGLYTDACMPATGMFEDAFNTELCPDFGGIARMCKFDYSEIKVLQSNQLSLAQSIAASPTFIPNEQRAAQGLPRIEDPAMDAVYFKTGYQSIDDFEPLPPIE